MDGVAARAGDGTSVDGVGARADNGADSLLIWGDVVFDIAATTFTLLVVVDDVVLVKLST